MTLAEIDDPIQLKAVTDKMIEDGGFKWTLLPDALRMVDGTRGYITGQIEKDGRSAEITGSNALEFLRNLYGVLSDWDTMPNVP